MPTDLKLDLKRSDHSDIMEEDPEEPVTNGRTMAVSPDTRARREAFKKLKTGGQSEVRAEGARGRGGRRPRLRLPRKSVAPRRFRWTIRTNKEMNK